MINETTYVTDNIEFTTFRGEYVSSKDRSIQAIRSALDSVKGISINAVTEANTVSGLPNFIHLNPELLALVLLFRAKHKKQPLESMKKKTTMNSVDELLKKLFPSAKLKEMPGIALRADALRYIKMVEDNEP
jgi:hypothetical protein